jgi:hypothetical protein
LLQDTGRERLGGFDTSSLASRKVKSAIMVIITPTAKAESGIVIWLEAQYDNFNLYVN